MKLTKDQRFTAYCIMLAETEDKSNYEDAGLCSDGFCWLINELFENYDFDRIWQRAAILPFRELMKKKPRYAKDGSLWFSHLKDGWEKRIELLNQCIIETHP